jgi:hypothetical protein
MADQGAADAGTATSENYGYRRRTYDGFVRLVKFSLAAIVIVLALMAIFLT